MKRKDVFAAFARKLGISRQNLENYRINDGRIYLPYLQSIFTDIKKLLSPADPTKKMSKSLGEKHYINLF